MADELVLSLRAAFAKGGRLSDTDDMNLDGLEIDVAGTDFIGPFTQTIGLTPEAIYLGDITGSTVGFIVGKNISTYNVANYITIRNGSGGADVVKAFGGDPFLFRAAANTLYADSNGDVQEILFWIVEA